jgi:hypothetical protein
MAGLTLKTKRQIVELLVPLMQTVSERRGLLGLALDDSSPVFRQLDFSGAPGTFVSNLISTLVHYGKTEGGKQALWILLEVVRDEVGVDKQQLIDDLRSEIESLSPTRLEGEPEPPKQGSTSGEIKRIRARSDSGISPPGLATLRPPVEDEIQRGPKSLPEEAPTLLSEVTATTELSPEDVANNYLDSMRPIPPNAPRFYMASCLVSNDLYYHFVCANRYWHPIEGECKVRGDVDDSYLAHWSSGQPSDEERNLPVTNISFRAAEAFANWLSKLTDHKIRLPKFEEWQIAASARRANWIDEEVQAGRVNYFGTSGAMRAIDAFDPNPFGIRDLLGNAYDMCISLDDPQAQLLLLVGGCYHSARPQLQEENIVDSTKTCLSDASFRCVRGV